MKKLGIYTLLLLLTACAQVEDEWVNFDYYGELDPETAFIPYYTELDGAETGQYIMNLLDELTEEAGESESSNDAPLVMRTSSTNSVGLAKALFSYWHSDLSRSYCGTYRSADEDGNPIRLSGRVIVPTNKKVSRIMVVSHYTIGANAEAPSMSFPLEGIFASRGIAVIVPDYIGYGVTADRVHPYLCADLTAENVIDMYLTTKVFLEKIGCSPEHEDILLFGYSQGGATTMAVARMLETRYAGVVNIRLVMAGGGPYDPCTTYDKMIDKDFTDYPCAIPMIIQGMNIGHDLGLDYGKFFKQNTLENMDEWINSKTYAMAEITKLMGTKRLSDIMTPEACNKVSDGMSDLYLALLANSLTNGWIPSSPVYMFHSMDDNVVPFENAELMLQSIQSGNVQYNFGHYGNHVKGYLRFLYTVVNLLYEHGEIQKKFI